MDIGEELGQFNTEAEGFVSMDLDCKGYAFEDTLFDYSYSNTDCPIMSRSLVELEEPAYITPSLPQEPQRMGTPANLWPTTAGYMNETQFDDALNHSQIDLDFLDEIIRYCEATTHSSSMVLFLHDH